MTADDGAADVAALTTYVGALSPTEDGYVTRCATEAAALVDNFIDAVKTLVPAEIRARAILEVGADLYHRKTTRMGVVGFEGQDATPFRVSSDPMRAAYPLLRQYIPAMGL
jgi:hypothetical protein